MNSLEEPREWSFPKDPDEAEERFRRWLFNDPLPEICPALLNSGDIYDYARITGMIWPFCQDDKLLEKRLKCASYEIDLLGTAYLIDGSGKRKEVRIEKDTPFDLPKNSIAYVSIATALRLPAYIAMRFNLRINLVHRGLLLGTGPLVDPGFAGNLLIPLHNLTSKECCLTGGQGFIWAEFTKLSPHVKWKGLEARQHAHKYHEFPESKRHQSAQQYFAEASGGQPAESSIPSELRTVNKLATDAQENARRATEELRKFEKVGGAALVLALLVGVISTAAFIRDAMETAGDASKNASDAIITTGQMTDKLHRELDALVVTESERIAALQRQIEALDARIQTLEPVGENRGSSRREPMRAAPEKSGGRGRK